MKLVIGMKFHFVSGLPRSGSTLLSAILRQNPRVHSGMTSPVVTAEDRRPLARGLFDSYYARPGRQGCGVRRHRMWTEHLPMLLDQFPQAKIIACVRNVAWVMGSIERRYAADPYEIIHGMAIAGAVTPRSTVPELPLIGVADAFGQY